MKSIKTINEYFGSDNANPINFSKDDMFNFIIFITENAENMYLDDVAQDNNLEEYFNEWIKNR
jgi:hypothetical protein